MPSCPGSGHLNCESYYTGLVSTELLREADSHFLATLMMNDLHMTGRKQWLLSGPRTLITYLRPSLHCSSEGLDLPDASKEVSPGLSETLKIIEIGTIMLDSEDSSVNNTHPQPQRAHRLEKWECISITSQCSPSKIDQIWPLNIFKDSKEHGKGVHEGTLQNLKEVHSGFILSSNLVGGGRVTRTGELSRRHIGLINYFMAWAFHINGNGEDAELK